MAVHSGRYGWVMSPEYRWSAMGRREITEIGRALVQQRFEKVGCAVTRDRDARSGRMIVRGRTVRSEVYVSAQRVGGYAFWTKRRLHPAAHRFAALVLLAESAPPELYLIPTLDWLNATPPLTDRDYIGLASEPEWGVEINSAALPTLRRYRWTSESAARLAQ